MYSKLPCNNIFIEDKQNLTTSMLERGLDEAKTETGHYGALL